MSRVFLFAVATVLTASATASAATAAKAQPSDGPCVEDVQKHCADAVGDRRAMRRCMRDNMEAFSQACRNQIEERRQQRGGGRGPREEKPADE